MASSNAIPMFGYTIRYHDIPQQYQHLKDQEFCVLIHQNPHGHQTDGVGILASNWYNPPPQHQQQQPYSINNTCGPPIPKDKHVNIKVYGTYNNIRQRKYDQLKHTLHYEYDGKDVYTNPNTRSIAFQSLQQFAEFYNECKTHPITSQLMSLPLDDWGNPSIYSYNIQLGIVTSIDHTSSNGNKPIKLQQLTINNNDNNNNINPTPRTSTTPNNSQDVTTLMNNITSGDILTLTNRNTDYYTPPCIGWLCLIVIDSRNRYTVSYPLLDLGEKVVVDNCNNNNIITSLISQCSQEQQQALYEIVHHWQNVEKNEKQYTYYPIPQYKNINPYDYIDIVKQAPAVYAKRVAEEKRIAEEAEEKRIAEEKIRAPLRDRFTKPAAEATRIQRSLLLQLYPNGIIPHDILTSLIEKEYQYNCLLPEEKEELEEQQVQDDTTTLSSFLVSSNITFDLSTLCNAITSIEDFAVIDYLNYLQQHVDYIMKQNLFVTNNTCSNSNNQHREQKQDNTNIIINTSQYMYQSYLRQQHGIKHRPQCITSQTTIDCILKSFPSELLSTIDIDDDDIDDDNHIFSTANTTTTTATTTNNKISITKPHEHHPRIIDDKIEQMNYDKLVHVLQVQDDREEKINKEWQNKYDEITREKDECIQTFDIAQRQIALLQLKLLKQQETSLLSPENCIDSSDSTSDININQTIHSQLTSEISFLRQQLTAKDQLLQSIINTSYCNPRQQYEQQWNQQINHNINEFTPCNNINHASINHENMNNHEIRFNNYENNHENINNHEIRFNNMKEEEENPITNANLYLLEDTTRDTISSSNNSNEKNDNTNNNTKSHIEILKNTPYNNNSDNSNNSNNQNSIINNIDNVHDILTSSIERKKLEEQCDDECTKTLDITSKRFELLQQNKHLSSSSPETITTSDSTSNININPTTIYSQLTNEINYLRQQFQIKDQQYQQQLKYYQDEYKEQLQAKDEQLKIKDDQLKAKDQQHQKQLESKDQQYQQQLKVKDQQYQQQLESKDQQYQQQLKVKDEQLKTKDEQYQKQLESKDEQLKIKDEQYQKQLESKDQQIAMLMKLLSAGKQ